MREKRKFLRRYGRGGRSIFSTAAHNEDVAVINALQNMQIVWGNRTEIIYAEGNVTLVLQAPAQVSQGLVFKGEWDSGTAYVAQNVVFYPTGSLSGAYIALTDVPAGTAPDTGAPYWVSWPHPPPGVWM